MKLNNNSDIIVVTSGEPAGIGPEICLDIFRSLPDRLGKIIVLGDIDLFILRNNLFGKNVMFNIINPDIELSKQMSDVALNIINLKCNNVNNSFELDEDNVEYVINMLDLAISLAKNNKVKSIVTAPVHKAIINKKIPFSGHTEYFADAFGVSKVVMMLASPVMRVALVTTHLPLSKVASAINHQNVYETIKITNDSLKSLFGIDRPKIAVCGLNPHAGENGVLGNEEIDVINPVINELHSTGVNVTGSYSADTIFNQVNKYDAIVAMYHDQGLPVLKYSSFESSVNITLGLPILRVSVDHGTAIDIARFGLASSGSLVCAIITALNNNEK